MEGNYVKTAVSDNGTLGEGRRTTDLGILHDEEGQGRFGIDDYLTPGVPWEMFAVSFDGTGIVNNNNRDLSITIRKKGLTDISASSAYDQHVRWEGYYESYFGIVNEYYFNDGDERIGITTTITAMVEMTGLKFLRSLDPDPDRITFDLYETINGRGYDSNGDGDFNDPDDLAPSDWVHSQGEKTGLTIGLYTQSDKTHNTGISNFFHDKGYWSSDPDDYLDGLDDGNGDNVIGLAFELGSLSAGKSVAIDYAYIMGASLDTVDIPQTTPVPAPGAFFLLGSGIIGLAGVTRKKSGLTVTI